MSYYLGSSINNVVSLDLDSSWAAKSLQEALKYNQTEARFQQKQMQEKEEKLLRLYESQQQRAIERVNRGSAESSNSSTSNNGVPAGKVRQMFDERRQKAGIDRSYPLEPLRVNRSNEYNGVNNKEFSKTVRTTVKRQVIQTKNGKPIVNKKEVVHGVYNNNNGDESYEERVVRDNNLNRPILNRTYKRRDLEMMMREHSRNENIEDEEFPDINIEQYEDCLPKPQLNNINRVSPVGAITSNKEFGKTKTIVKSRSPETLPSPQKEVKSYPKQIVRSSPKSLLTKETSPSPKAFTPSSPSRQINRSSPGAMSSKNTLAKSANKSPSKQGGKPSSAVVRDDLHACQYCNRRFAEDRLATHEDICSKTGKKKRKVYDATKHRVQGTELEPYTKKQTKTLAQKNTTLSNSTSKQQNRPQPGTVKKTDWRRKHEEFIGAIRAAKMAQAHVAKGGKLSDLPPPPPSENPDYVQCPHCGRRFNQSAAERHIPKCASYDFNKPKPSRGGRK